MPFSWLWPVDLILAALGAWAVMRWADRLGLLDHPNHRSSHQKPTPKGGGGGILIAFIFNAIWVGSPPLFWLSPAIAALLALVGDRREIEPKLRLGAQFVLALALLLGVVGLPAGAWGWLLLTWWCFFIVGTANIYNFMDGINGLGALTGMLGFGFSAFYLSQSAGLTALSLIAWGMAVACLGFLPFNFPRARVFMGDVGSILLGFVYGALVAFGSRSWLDFLCLASFLFTYYADEISTMALRLWRGENLLQAHRSHLYQLLANEMGLSHGVVSLSYAAGQLFIGLCVLWVRPAGTLAVLGLLAMFFAAFITLSLWIRTLAKAAQER